MASSNALIRTLSLLLAFLPCAQAAVAADGTYRLEDKQVLAGALRWDYLSVDPASHRLYLTRGDQVDVFDTKTKRIVASIANTPGVHGVAIAGELDRGYTSNGAANSVTVFALSSSSALASIPVGAKPDSIVYDPKTRRVFVANGSDKTLSVIDTGENKVVATIALPGVPETAVVDAKGLLFIAIEDQNAIAAIDTGSLRIVRRIDVSSVCDEPAGLAIDAASDRLFVGCHNSKMAIVDGLSGRILSAPAIGRGNDATGYDAERKLAFASNGEGSLTVVDGNPPYAALQTVATMPRARTMALDPQTHAIYLVSAEADDAPAPAVAGQKPRPKLKPNTFTVLTVSPR